MFYISKDDHRIVVPKKGIWKKWGWTINFAHRLAIPILLLFIIMAVGPLLFMLALFALSWGAFVIISLLMTLIFSIIGIIVVAHHLATDYRG